MDGKQRARSNGEKKTREITAPKVYSVKKTNPGNSFVDDVLFARTESPNDSRTNILLDTSKRRFDQCRFVATNIYRFAIRTNLGEFPLVRTQLRPRNGQLFFVFFTIRPPTRYFNYVFPSSLVPSTRRPSLLSFIVPRPLAVVVGEFFPFESLPPQPTISRSPISVVPRGQM